jgi:phage terminase large subunit
MSKPLLKIIDTGYEPRPLQHLLHKSLKRFNVICCHRRFGKTVFSINEMIDQGIRCDKKNPQFAYLAPTYGQAKRVAWDYMKEFTKHIPGVETNEADLRVDIPRPAKGDRLRFMLLGAENPGTLKGIYLDGVLLDEFAECDPIVWSTVIRPALSDRLGWAIFIGTPRGQNHFYDIYQFAKAHPEQDWFHVMYKASETGIIPIGELEAAKSIMSPEEYDQEYECSFSAALVGAYYGKEMQKLEDQEKLTKVPYDPMFPVFTGWDLGMDDTTSIWCAQIVGKSVHIIDYIEDSGASLDFYVKVLNDRGYNYEEHFLPHDAAAREMGTGKSRVETLRSLGLNRITVVPRQRVEDGVNAVRMLLPKCWIDADNCKRGIDALRAYERKWDTKNKIYQSSPLHNWASNGADGFRTLAMGMDESRPMRSQMNLPRESQRDYNIFGGRE